MSQRETNTRLRDPIMVRPTLSRFINTLLFFLLVIQVFPPRFPSFLKLFLLFDHLPSAYLFSAQLSGLTPGREFFYGGLASVTNFIQLYLHQFFIDSHSLNGYGKPLKRPFHRYQSHLEAISIG